MKRRPDEEIDYTKFHSKSGMKTKMWGPHAWNFLFVSILGTYPVKINSNNKEHLKIKRHFKSLMLSLPVILPCVFCRRSFKSFLKELPIEPYLRSRIDLFYWLYLMKDKVNKKLIEQERQAYILKKKELKKKYENNQITKKQLKKEILEYRQNSFCTIPSPPFEKVLRKYEKYRAKSCSQKAQTCA